MNTKPAARFLRPNLAHLFCYHSQKTLRIRYLTHARLPSHRRAPHQYDASYIYWLFWLFIMSCVIHGSPALLVGAFAPHPTKPVGTPDDRTCAVCLNDVADEEWDIPQHVEWPACGHFAHRECLRHTGVCPICRAPLGRPAVQLPEAAVAPAAPAAPATTPADLRRLQQELRTVLTDQIRRAIANGTMERRRAQFQQMIDNARQAGVLILPRNLGM